MFSAPAGLTEETLVAALGSAWRVDVETITYRPVGFGSHHWEVGTVQGDRWFATVDELELRRHRQDEPLDRAYDRLRAALGTTVALHAALGGTEADRTGSVARRGRGRSFVVAPVPTVDGEPLTRVGERFGLALYPHVAGESFTWGDFPSAEHRRAVLDMLVAVHTAPAHVRRQAAVDDLTVAHRDALDDALRAGPVPGCGPYARPVADLLAVHAAPIRRLLDRYDTLATEARGYGDRAVLTHGEPHPGNTMRDADGWLLIDWETALVAPRERDLWNLDPGDGSVLAAYADATGVPPEPSLLELYRIQWDLKDLAVDVDRFRRPHTGSADDEACWKILQRLVRHLGGRGDTSPS
ncbi:phosphotransferase [Micromonospora sp. NPDC023956]|uniref:phosphotransferase n=1 Tax=Micromonospora sp. NPDC023956 TaxID=3155722 RepID=UPI0034069173